ncbi:MAG TPA: ester cyclase [Rubrobacteraceae bacterium]|nr:ester cyclase [Rubrobacteraceae bacterium]
MSAEENKAIVRRVIEECFNQGNLDVIDELIAPDYVDHDPAMPEEVRGPEGFRQFVSMYRSAFPDIHIQIKDQVAEGDRVAMRWVATGTHDGELIGIAPTGNRVTTPGMSIDRISGGKVAETRDNYDAMGMMTQLGVIPAPQEAQA